jgi:hypothetical protein
MSRLFELGGGENWYSGTADRNVQILYKSVFSQTGEPYYISSGNALWQGVSFLFDNSTGLKNEIQDQTSASLGLTNLTNDGDCIYVDLDRSQNRTVAGSNPIIAQKGNLTTLGTSSPPGSRYVLVVKIGAYYYTRGQYLPVGSLYRVATTSIVGGVELNATPYNPTAPQVATVTNSDILIGSSGISRYNTGTVGAITIGGHSGVDWQIILDGPDNASNVLVKGYQTYQAGNKLAAFQVDQYGDSTGNKDAHIVDFRSADSPSTISSKVYIDAQGAIGQTNTKYLPSNDLKNAAAGVGAVTFMRPSKYWLADVVAVYNAHLATLVYSVSTSGGQKRLTSTTNQILVVDTVSPNAAQRVLFIDSTGASLEQGLWVVTQAGSVSTPWILDRPIDFKTTKPISSAMAVRVSTGGYSYGGQYFILTTADPIVLESTFLSFGFTDKYTWDQYCIKWGDGSVNVLSESASYNTWGA